MKIVIFRAPVFLINKCVSGSSMHLAIHTFLKSNLSLFKEYMAIKHKGGKLLPIF